MAGRKKTTNNEPVATNWQGNTQNRDVGLERVALKKLAQQAASRDTGVPVSEIQKGKHPVAGKPTKRPTAKKKASK